MFCLLIVLFFFSFYICLDDSAVFSFVSFLFVSFFRLFRFRLFRFFVCLGDCAVYVYALALSMHWLVIINF